MSMKLAPKPAAVIAAEADEVVVAVVVAVTVVVVDVGTNKPVLSKNWIHVRSSFNNSGLKESRHYNDQPPLFSSRKGKMDQS
jgi:hypothetical protein